MDLGLKGKVAIVTGSSRGIGKAIATALAAEGSRVALCARTAETLEQTARSLTSGGAVVRAVPADLGSPDGPARLVAETVQAFGRVDILVNNVGGARAAGPFLDTPDGVWQGTVDLNLMAAARCSRLVVPEMQKAGGGSIVHIASISARFPSGGSGGRTRWRTLWSFSAGSAPAGSPGPVSPWTGASPARTSRLTAGRDRTDAGRPFNRQGARGTEDATEAE
jgi:3-oxoacyl-[acyl-carrier protein] reductase